MTPIIFLPGASGRLQFWNPLIECLAHSTLKDQPKHVVGYPGFANEPLSSDVVDFKSLKHYVLGQMQQLLGAHQGIVVAQSMGGIFAIQAALEFGHQIKALVLIATSGGIDLSGFDVLDWRQDETLKRTTPDWLMVEHEFMDHRLAEIQCPVLLVWGSEDAISPVSVGTYLKHSLPHASLKIVESGQHDLAHVHAAKLAQMLDVFMQTLNEKQDA